MHGCYNLFLNVYSFNAGARANLRELMKRMELLL